jgi:hypothetical protein
MFPEAQELNFDKTNSPSAGINGANPTKHRRVQDDYTIWDRMANWHWHHVG